MKAPAIHCDAIKIAYRQSKDGFVVSFAIHPQDMPAVLANADIGSQWRLVLSELDEDGNAEEVMPNTEHGRSVPANKTVPASESDSPARARERKFWDEMPASQQAGVLCKTQSFWRYLTEVRADGEVVRGDEDATCVVRNECLVDTRARLDIDEGAARKWRELVSDYRAWQLAAQVVPA